MTRDWIRHIDRLIQQRPVSRSALEAFRGIALLMEEARPEAMPVHVEQEVRDVQQKEGFPLFSREDLPLDLKTAGDLLKKFLAHLSRSDRDDARGLEKALKKAESAGDWTEGLFVSILKQDDQTVAEMGRDVNLDPGVLTFLGKTALRPSMERLREDAAPYLDKTGWDKGYCPLCGSQPDMACLKKTGKRYLHCELCGEKWPYPRIQCPFCNTVEQEKLGYFEAEEEEGLRVYFCRECHRYIKTVDMRAFEETAPLEVEGLASLHLDVLAQENGFR